MLFNAKIAKTQRAQRKEDLSAGLIALFNNPLSLIPTNACLRIKPFAFLRLCALCVKEDF
jgi:hypothetical protein